jgi:large conductance mechanosensitive channel
LTSMPESVNRRGSSGPTTGAIVGFCSVLAMGGEDTGGVEKSLMLKEFRQFILRGNLVDLAVAVVVGTAFTALVNSMVKSLITPLIAAVFGKHDFSNLAFTINGSRFLYGDFINALITFLTVAAVMFFLVIKPVNALMERFRTEPDVDKETRDCPECLSAIPVGAKRCAFCTTELARA